MSSSVTCRWIFSLCTTLAVSEIGTADAQIILGRPGGGLIVRAPFAPTISVGVGPIVPYLPRPVLPRRRALLVAPPIAATTTTAQQIPGRGATASRYAPGGTTASADSGAIGPAPADQIFPTEAELGAFDDGTLLNALLDASTKLDAELGRFDTGAGWQKYLSLPADALPPPSADGHVTLGFRSLTGTLQRINSVAANPQYPMISGLPSFVATKAALEEVVRRFGGRGATGGVAAAAPAGKGEELPTPPPTLAAPANDGQERSILAR